MISRARLSLTLLAEASIRVGDLNGARNCLQDAEAFVHDCEEHYYEPEICRAHARLASNSSRTDEAIEWIEKALQTAQKQRAQSLELRATMDLAHLWSGGGQRTEALERLVSVYEGFTEGFDTAELKEAKGVLDTLS